MLIPGTYKAENPGGILGTYKIVISVKETKKSFILTLISDDGGSPYDQMKSLFKNSERVVVSKTRSKHALRVWGDAHFTIYPFRAGIPFVFKRIL